jgi:hypothetical protein
MVGSEWLLTLVVFEDVLSVEIGFELERRATTCSAPKRLKKLCDRHRWYQSIRK